MLKVSQEKDRVVIDLGGRKRDVLLRCGAAERFAEALEKRAALAELEPPTLCTGVWDCKVESYDGLVAVRFLPPFVGAPEQVRMPAAAARALADMVRFKGQQAAYKMRFEFR